MLGDQNDFIARVRAVLPAGWFKDDDQVLAGILAGIANGWAWVFGQQQAVRAQGRLATAFGWGLDNYAQDFFGNLLQRRSNEADEAYRARIDAALLPDGATRGAMIKALTALTGQAPFIFEPRNPIDTGGYNTGFLGYNTSGGYGNLDLHNQAFITVQRAQGGGIAGMQGYYDATAPYGAGGYNTGLIEYAQLSMVSGGVQDSDIFATVAAVKPEGSIMWTRISGNQGLTWDTWNPDTDVLP